MFRSIKEAELAWIKEPAETDGALVAMTCPYAGHMMADDHMERLLIVLQVHYDVLYIVNYPLDGHITGRIQFICRVKE